MGGKKKGKGSKLARMSEEERLRYLQHRAAIEEEARRRKEQLIATFMKNKLKREEAFSRLNVAKINQQWRQTLRRYKCLELRQDLESLFKWFVHTASKKTKQIDVLLEDLDEAESQYSRIHQCHMEIIDRLLDIHKRRVDFFQKQYEQEWKEIYEKATNEMNAIVSWCTFDQDHLKAILFRMKETHCLNVKETVAKQTVKTDELRNNMLMELENLIVSRETRIEQLWQMIQTVLRDHWEVTEDRRRQYISLRDADFENWKQIFHFYQQINHSNEVIIGLRAQLFKVRVNGEEKIQEVKEEKEECNKLFKILRKQLDNDREKDKINLSFLTGSAQDATKVLTKIHKKGEQIIQLLSLCKKLEVMKDQISPYIIDKNYLNENQEKDLEESTDFREKIAQEVVINFSKLKNFWKRYNQAIIEKESLALTVKSLEVEQKELKNSVRRYLSDAVLIKPSMKIRVTIHRPYTTQTQKPSHSAMQERKVFSSVPYVEALYSPSIREMIKIQTGK